MSTSDARHAAQTIGISNAYWCHPPLLAMDVATALPMTTGRKYEVATSGRTLGNSADTAYSDRRYFLILYFTKVYRQMLQRNSKVNASGTAR